MDVDRIKERHGLRFERWERLLPGGIFNTVYALGDELVLRVPRDDPFFVATARKELAAVPAARAAGVRTPALVAADDSGEIVPVPYAIYERAPGATIEAVGLDPLEATEPWRELGADLARLHAGVDAEALAGVRSEELPAARALLAELPARGNLSTLETRWLSAWLDLLEPLAVAPARPCFVHGDIQASNVLVVEGGHRYSALLDWGGCGWAEASHDFAGIPLRAVPTMLDGYRSAGAPEDDALEARILLRQLQLALFDLGRGPQPGHSWAERPATMLVDTLRLFAGPVPAEWDSLRPPSLPAGPPTAWSA